MYVYIYIYIYRLLKVIARGWTICLHDGLVPLFLPIAVAFPMNFYTFCVFMLTKTFVVVIWMCMLFVGVQPVALNLSQSARGRVPVLPYVIPSALSAASTVPAKQGILWHPYSISVIWSTCVHSQSLEELCTPFTKLVIIWSTGWSTIYGGYTTCIMKWICCRSNYILHFSHFSSLYRPSPRPRGSARRKTASSLILRGHF